MECLDAIAECVDDKLGEGLDAASTGLRDLQDDLAEACTAATERDVSNKKAVIDLTCAGADLAGGLASAFEAGKTLLSGGCSTAGLVTTFLEDEDKSEIDCVVDILLDVHMEASDEQKVIDMDCGALLALTLAAPQMIF
jgi:hypothetical protein